ncbi:MerR family transcriptional regulator [Corynebacterium guangdongense]|uniref:DNA-binding transcriptional MerR regulator n=1 Tax=Corynebacterium guangdongense TaxID=1783348 RepID=A0ABU1ZZ91_9CORY|nr:MerR family transcriptional regulator [Corynebacterium guangdongense]MDR7330247.1 DNA-binding transcriptional MerR regulator [Corynebacterium guangdongense]WJZ18805.1 HTH-type transcriptional activator TipA [Corynebacterium guangdongense]
MSDHTIGEAADILKVTTRTLRHWDSIGLLTPSRRTTADHRLYSDEDLAVGARILIYRGAGMALADITRVLAEPASAREHLTRQRRLISEKIARLRRMNDTIDILLEENMSTEHTVDAFGDDWPGYAEEAEARWGGTPEWDESQRRARGFTAGDREAFRRRQAEFVELLADAAARGVAPGTAEAAALVDKHLASIEGFYELNRDRQVILARMYAADERFDAAYRGHGAYLKELVDAQARAEGIDPGNANW